MTLTFAKRVFAALTLILMMSVSGLAVVTKLQGGNLLSVQSGSMVPTLSKGDLVSAKRVPVGELNLGDIITFVNPNNKKSTITHRIVQLPSWDNGQKFMTKGDANQSEDRPIAATEIIGKVNHSIPLLGYGADFVRKPLGLILIIYIPALGIMISELKRLAKYYKSQQPYIILGREGKLVEYGGGGAPALKLVPLLLIVPLFFSMKAYAALQSTATLTGTTISTAPVVTPPTNPCAVASNNTGATANVSGGNSSSSSHVNVSSSSSQTATTGNASSNNGSGGSATSGNATNCNSTNINITVH